MLLAQRDPASFPELLAFRPERFVDTRLDPYRWFPFGGGTRRCIGMSFALFEMRVVLARDRDRSPRRPPPRVVPGAQESRAGGRDEPLDVT